ncbi:MaoC family dehydratase [Panacagrimonas sp.]|uniref:MaoC family dehydratase n=1 Tax=Panacagrimonas sp. TaxID=2480088 RepID=UPI003B52B6A7
MLYFEDFHPGQEIDLGHCSVSESEIVDFARQFDPQPFHVDHEAARASHFGGLVASGWHTCSLLMRQIVENLLLRSASHGSPGVDEIRWLLPVRPGDVLSTKMKVIEITPSKSRPDRGVIRCEYVAFNQAGACVVTMKTLGMFGRRPQDAA